jgi:uncharacterized protein
VLTATAEYRHESIPAAADAVARIARGFGLEPVASDDPAVLDDLGDAAAVVLLHASGDVLGERRRATLAKFVRAGGGFAAIHGAATAEPGWPGYVDLVGARFRSHPPLDDAFVTIRIEDAAHPSTAHLPSGGWRWSDEWYAFDRNPRDRVRVLLTVDETEYGAAGDDAMGADHPLAWAGEHGAGRTFVTALGHRASAWADPTFLGHVRGGIASVLRTA